MDNSLREAVEKLNSDVRNYLTPIFGYVEILACTASEPEKQKLAVITSCAGKILTSLNEFITSAQRLSPGQHPPSPPSSTV